MSKETFYHPENYQHLKLLDEAAYRGGVGRGKAFEDFLRWQPAPWPALEWSRSTSIR